MERKLIPPDGSCLFNAIYYAVTGLETADAAETLRALVAQTIEDSPDQFTEVYLGKPPEEYVRWIKITHNYGGEAEILILAQHFQVNICVVTIDKNVTTLMYKSTEIKDRAVDTKTIFILYNGQHYDTLVLKSPYQHIFTELELTELDICAKATELATNLKDARDKDLRKRQRKRIQCSCGTICLDAADFQRHAVEIEHGDEWGYDCTEIFVEEMVENPNDE